MGKRARCSDEELFVVKCSLGRLLPSADVRNAIEQLTLRLHHLSVYGSLLAQHVALKRLEAGQTVPISDQKFWYQCMSAWGRACKRSILPTDIRDAQGALGLKYAIPLIDSSRMNVILNSFAINFTTNASVALAQTFHRNLKRAFSRIISIYEEACGALEKKDRYHILLSCMNICLGARNAKWATVPKRLKTLLQSQIDDWRTRYAPILPCPFPNNITDKNASIILSWSYELQMHLGVCNHLDDVHFRKGDLKKTQLLPIASHKVKFMQIDKSILEQCIIPFINDAKETPFSVSNVITCFPGIEKLKPNTASFQGSLKTDGVSASVVFKRPIREVVREWKPGKGLVHVEKTDLNSLTPPVIPHIQQRLVAVDPGRRDMLVGVVHGTDKVVKFSTKWYLHMSGRNKFKSQSESRFDKLTSRGSLLSIEKQQLPTHKVSTSQGWVEYLDALLPILPEILKIWQQRFFRRQSLKSYIAIDKALTRQCRAITGRRHGTLVAFGAANSCHTGFGYAPVPQKRLRHRLSAMHGARVSLISEYYTSQICTLCDSHLLPVYSNGKDVWGVRKCPQCRHSGAPLHVHRDVNAAKNILRIYLELAHTGQRPIIFTHAPET